MMGYNWQTRVQLLGLCPKASSLAILTIYIHQPPKVLHPTIASWPFEARVLDVVGSLSKSSGGHLYILAATDYFSKWVEVVSLKQVKK